MPNYNQIVVNGIEKLNLRNDTVAAAHLEYGYTAHDSSGAQIAGTLNIKKYYCGSGNPPSNWQDGDLFLKVNS